MNGAGSLRLLLPLGLALGLAAVLAIVLGSRMHRDGSPAAPPPAGAVAAAADSGAPASSEPATRSEVSQVRNSAPPLSTPLELRIQVLQPRGTPAANAELWVLSPDDPVVKAGGRTRGVWEVELGSARMEQLARKPLVDRRGLARLEHDGRALWIFAKSSEGIGSLDWRPGEEEAVVLRLRGPLELSVQLLDHLGRPVSGMLAWLWNDEPDGFAHSTANQRTVARAGDGVAFFESWRFLPTPSWPTGVGFVHLEVAAAEDAQLAVPTDPWPQGTIPFVLPPLGSLEVVVNGLGRNEMARVRLHRAGDDPATSRAAVLQLREGRAVFPRVALGKELLAVVDLQSQNGCLRMEGPGPRQPGERTTFVVDLAGAVELRGRIIDRTGAPAPMGRWSLVLTDGARRHQGNLTVGEEGRFSYFLDAELARSGWSTILVSLADRRVDGAALEASAPLPPMPGPGVCEVGDLVLATVPWLVAGRAVDPSGRPVTGAQCFVHRRTAAVGSDPPGPWLLTSLANGASPTDAEGRFALLGAPPAAKGTEFGLVVRCEGHRLPEPVRFQPGQRDLLVVLEVCGGLNASVRLPGLVQGMQFTIRLEPIGGGEVVMLTAELLDGHEHVWSTVPPGRYDLELLAPFAAGPLARVPGVLVAPGEPTRDPRLLPIDLSATVGCAELVLREPEGGPLSSRIQLIWHLPDGSRSGWWPDEFHGARYPVPFVRAAPLDLLVRTVERADAWLPAFSADAEVVLGWLPVRLRLRGPLPPEGLLASHGILWRRTSLDGRRELATARIRMEGKLAGGGIATAFLPGEGLYKFSWTQPVDARGAVLRLARGGEWTIDRASQGSLLEVDLPIEPPSGH